MNQDPNKIPDSFNDINILLKNESDEKKKEEDGIDQNALANLSQNKERNKNRNIFRIIRMTKRSKKRQKNSNKKENTNTQILKKRKDNIRRSAFSRLMIGLKCFFRKMFRLNFDSFNFQKNFGKSIGKFKEKMRWKIYQILCCVPGNKKQLMNFLKTEKKISKRLTFFYFMTRTYEELYKRYISGNINFPIIPNGTVRICNFITLQKVIKENFGEDPEYFQNFENVSRSMLNDFDTKERTRDNSVKKIHKKEKIIIIDIFEEMRNHFNEEGNSTGLGVEEKNKSETK